MRKHNGQMVLDISLRENVSFDSFVTGHNAELIHHLSKLAEGREVLAPLFIWGESGGGKSHLLNSCYSLASRNMLRPCFVPLSEFIANEDVECMHELDEYDLYLIDDLDHIVGHREWEEQLFQLCNAARDNRKSIIISAIKPPTSLNLALRDLVTRLMSGLTYHVLPLGEEQKIAALQERAKDRGFEVSEDAVKFILNRYRRETGHLFSMLDKIDLASLEQKRLITIPFLRSLNLE